MTSAAWETHREAARTVRAFLNRHGGYALFGVTQAGVVSGQQFSERTIEESSAGNAPLAVLRK